jgi:hypothetical protein
MAEYSLLKVILEEYEKFKGVPEERAKICETCDRRKLDICGECFCILTLKVRLPNTGCPLGKW